MERPVVYDGITMAELLFPQQGSLTIDPVWQDKAGAAADMHAFKVDMADFAEPAKIGAHSWLFHASIEQLLSVKQQRAKQFLPQLLPFLPKHEIDGWHQLLSEIFYCQLIIYNRDRVLARTQVVAQSLQALESTYRQLQAIDDIKQVTIKAKKWSLETNGFDMSDWTKQQKEAMLSAPNAFSRDWLDEMNWYRLYWVWAGGNGGLVGSFLDLEAIKKQWQGSMSALSKLEKCTPFFGVASWALYFIRLSLHSVMFVKHAITNRWMGEEEAQLDEWLRVKAQWQQRKFVILNDIVWGGVDFVTIYWLTGAISPMMGALGGLLTIGLMYFDVLMAQWDHQESRTNYEANLQVLNQQLEAVKARLAHEVLSPQQRLELETQQQALQDEKSILSFNWSYTDKMLSVNTSVSAWFVLSMALMYAPILPVLVPAIPLSTSLAATTVFIGCIMSVALTAYQTYCDYSLQIDKQKSLLNAGQLKLDKLSITDEPTMLVKAQLEANTLYHQATITNLHHQLYHSLAFQCLFPVVVVGALTLPMAWAALTITVTLSTALATKAYINGQKPEEYDVDTLSDSVAVSVDESKPAPKLLSHFGLFKAVESYALAPAVEDSPVMAETTPVL